MLQASPAAAPQETLPRAAREGGGRAVAGELLDLLVASLTDGEGEQADPSLFGDGGGLPRRPLSAPYLCQHSWRHVEWT